MIELPLTSEHAAAVLTLLLGGSLFRVGIRWNERSAGWFLDLSTADGAPLLLGLRIVPDWDLTGRFTDPRLPAGRMVAVDTSGQGLPPGRDDLGGRVVVVFVPEGEA